MGEIPQITIIVVTVAAAWYIGKQIGGLMSLLMDISINRCLQSISKLHEDAYHEIRTEFDFWWSGDPSRIVRKALRDSPGLLSEELGLSDSVVDAMIEPSVDFYRGIALHLAVHARIGAKERAIIRRLPAAFGLRKKAHEAYMRHGIDLKEQRTKLLETGIDLEALERHFAAA